MTPFIASVSARLSPDRGDRRCLALRAPGYGARREGQNRGNSVYFRITSFRCCRRYCERTVLAQPLVDRLCMACEMEIDAHGEIRIPLLRSSNVLAGAPHLYQVAAMLVDQDAALRKEYAPLVPHLENLYALYKILNKARHARGAVDLSCPRPRSSTMNSARSSASCRCSATMRTS